MRFMQKSRLYYCFSCNTKFFVSRNRILKTTLIKTTVDNEDIPVVDEDIPVVIESVQSDQEDDASE